MRRATLGIVTLVLAGHAYAVAEEIRPELRQCIVGKVQALDDGLSPAGTVADAAVSECWPELQQNCPRCGEEVFRRVMELVRPWVTAEVLKYRASRRPQRDNGSQPATRPKQPNTANVDSALKSFVTCIRGADLLLALSSPAEDTDHIFKTTFPECKTQLSQALHDSDYDQRYAKLALGGGDVELMRSLRKIAEEAVTESRLITGAVQCFAQAAVKRDIAKIQPTTRRAILLEECDSIVKDIHNTLSGARLAEVTSILDQVLDKAVVNSNGGAAPR
jgi:hypothetical protein